MKTSILIVEDDKAIQNLLAATLDANAYQCYTADDGEKAIFYATVKRPDIIISTPSTSGRPRSKMMISGRLTVA